MTFSETCGVTNYGSGWWKETYGVTSYDGSWRKGVTVKQCLESGSSLLGSRGSPYARYTLHDLLQQKKGL